MRCENCGAEYSFDMSFCGNCGLPLRVNPGKADLVRRRCPSCGMMSWNPDICTNCSARLPPNHTIEARFEQEVKNGVLVKRVQIVTAKCPRCGTVNQDREYCSNCGDRLPRVEDFPTIRLKEIREAAERDRGARFSSTTKRASFNLTIEKGKPGMGRQVQAARLPLESKARPMTQEPFAELNRRSNLWAVIVAMIVAIFFLILVFE